MATEIKAPTFPESIADGSVANWHKKPGESFVRDEPLVDIETDKVVIEVVAPDDGVLSQIIKAEGDTVLSDEVVGMFEAGTAALSQTATHSVTPAAATDSAQSNPTNSADDHEGSDAVSPSLRKLATEHGVNLENVKGSGKKGRIQKEDIMAAVAASASATKSSSTAKPAEAVALSGARVERREPMSRLRAKIASRLVEAQQNMAMLTTFNEINMQPIMTLRTKYKDEFEKKHGVRLGFMSFFVRAAVEALKKYPAVNASIDGNDILYHSYQDIGVAVSSPRGLVVPILRDVDDMSLADIEANISAYGMKAKDGKLSMEDMTGGTFTISNGGVFGSLMSTPIVNPPQTAILGMHKIQDRPMAVDGQVVILPMMYLAMSYDHRLIDGKEAVGFLVAIKTLLEEPERLLLGL